MTVLTAELNVTEPDIGQSTTVTGCFSVNLTQPRTMNHSFELFVLSPNSTASLGSDFFPSLPFLTIPAADFNESVYTTCVDIIIVFGDSLAEVSPGYEVVVYAIRPLAPQDGVVYPQDRDSVVIYIYEGDYIAH